MARESFKERLRRVRGDEEPAVAPPADSQEEQAAEAPLPAKNARGMPRWLRRKLDRKRAAQPDTAGTEAAASARLPYLSDEIPVRLEESTGPAGDYCARITRTPRDYQHGEWQLSEISAARNASIALCTGDAALADRDLERAVYLDTETTGLSGGAGVYVFMIGLGSFREHATEGAVFECWQGFMREPGEERALLAEAARRIREASCLVTFFGKSFDRHRLEDKMRVAGVEPPFDGLPHLDLYHPCARLTKGSLPDGRLRTMESVLSGLQRPDDLPGSQAPAAWFDYLADRPHQLEGVFQHNLDDVLSLVTLAAWLGRVECEERADGRPIAGCATQRARALARACEDQGRRPEALSWIERALERCTAASLPARDLRLLHAETLRKSGSHESARAAFEEFLNASEDAYTVPALISLAKLLEHRFKEYGPALEHSERALALVDRFHVGSIRARHRHDLDSRLARLSKRQG